VVFHERLPAAAVAARLRVPPDRLPPTGRWRGREAPPPGGRATASDWRAMPSSPKPHWQDLFREVVETDTCSGCAACVVACPRKVLGYRDTHPFQMDEPSGPADCRFGDLGCDACVRACHRFHLDTDVIEQERFGRPRAPEELFGMVQQQLALRATQPQVSSRGQDGGLVSALLIWALETDRIDGAIVAGPVPGQPWRAQPTLVETREQVLACAGSYYTYSPNLLALAETAPDRRLALVSVPCQVSGVVKSQWRRLKRFRSVVLTVGLMCSETFTETGFLDELLHQRLELDLDQVRKVNVKGRVLVSTDQADHGRLGRESVPGSRARLGEGGIIEIPLKEARPTARPQCRWCPDFAAEWADLSAGGLGLEGWTITLLRTETGREWVQELLAAGRVEAQPAEAFPSALAVLERLSRIQRLRPARRRAKLDPHVTTGFDGTSQLRPVPPAPDPAAPAGEDG